jgi:hypothetical protein
MCWIVVLMLVVTVTTIYAAEEPPQPAGYLVPMDVNDPFVASEAGFALAELQKLSDSTIYSTLSLSRVVSAFKEDGIFHTNTVLEVELASPHFRSQLPREPFQMFVMTHKEDAVKSFAINEFPVMDDAAIEDFHVAKVERKKVEREDYLRLLEIESMSETVRAEVGPGATADVGAFFAAAEGAARLGVEQVRRQCTADIAPQLPGAYLAEEEQLVRMSLRDVYAVSVGAKNASDYQKYRSQRMLDVVVAHLQHL